MGSCIDFTIEEIQSFVSDFIESNAIGSGAFGHVYQGLISSGNKHNINSQAMVIKKSFGVAEEHYIQFQVFAKLI